MRRIVAVGVAGLALLGVGSFSRPDASSAPLRLQATRPHHPLLGIVRKRAGGELVRVHPRSLLPLRGRRVRISAGLGSVWSFSPDRSKLVIQEERAVGLSLLPWLRVLDVRTLRTLKLLPLESSANSHLYWPAPRRVLAIEPEDESFDVVVIDTVARRVVARRTVPGRVIAEAVAKAGRAVVMLVSSPHQIGPARLVVAGANGTVRSLALERIEAGTLYPDYDGSETSQPDPSRFIGHRRRPGLAVDPHATRAYVVDPAGLVAEVSLDDLSVRYHDVVPPRSALRRLLDWFEPDAQGKGPLVGPARYARWLGAGLIAVAGDDESAIVDAQRQVQARSRAAGLAVVDTRTWEIRTLDERASRFVTGGGHLIATGSSSDPVSGKDVGMGLAAYAVDGTKRFEAFAGQTVWVQYVLGRRAYVAVGNRLRIVDLSSGAVAGTVRGRVTHLLLADHG
jgi:hypothetical protein